MNTIASGIAGQMQLRGGSDPLLILQNTFERIKNEIVKLHPLFMEGLRID
ncbi:hypothetical protein [Paenibacillus sp. SI8]